MTTWNEAFIQTLVTDSVTLHDAEKLARSGVWSATGCDSHSAWGFVQGSGKSPYQVCIDLTDPATKCSCPSRKFPCKHAVGLMLLLARGTILASIEPPAWVTTWLEGRERKREAAPPTPKVPDTAAQAKREAARTAKVTAGIEELRLFLEDLMRRGLSDPAVKSYAFWDRVAARMVDAQMQPIARRLRALGGVPFQKKVDWVSLLMDEIGRLYTLTEAYQRVESLSESLSHDVRAALGFSLKQDEVLEQRTGVIDQWQILGIQTEQVEQLMERRTWLYGEVTQRYALLLDFAHRSRPFDAHYPLGQSFTGELVYYPGAYPQRAVVKERKGDYTPIPFAQIKLAVSVEAILDTYADALALNPFLQYVPAGLQQGWATRNDLIDTKGAKLPLSKAAQSPWLNAVIGGNWLPIFGEWDGMSFQIAALVTTDAWTQMREA
ncbi:MAG: SWIM zinc finger family protein [Chloroflexota bacterium]